MRCLYGPSSSVDDEPSGSAQKAKRALPKQRAFPVERSGQRYWQAPLSVQTVPHGQPLPPGAQLAYVAQFLQLSLRQVQLWPPCDTCVAGVYDV